jgi:filamin
VPDEPGKYEIAYVPEETGNHKLNVKYGKDHVKDSPFRVKVAPGGDASKVKVSGEGIEKPRVGQLVDIIFDTTEAGNGTLDHSMYFVEGFLAVPHIDLLQVSLSLSYSIDPL